MKTLTVKVSKQTGYKYLNADKVKKVIDDLIRRVEALEKKKLPEYAPWQDAFSIMIKSADAIVKKYKKI